MALVTCPIFEVFYGGARGGGKTDGVLGEWLAHAARYEENAIGLMIRRERTQLIETIERSRQLYAPLGARLHEQDKMWRFPNGARLRFAYLEHDADAEAYQGHSYTRVYVEEIGNFPSPAPIMKLMATLRSASGVPVGFRATGNPGGPGHGWVSERYIDPAPLGWKTIADEQTGSSGCSSPRRSATTAIWETTTFSASKPRVPRSLFAPGSMATGMRWRAPSSTAGGPTGTWSSPSRFRRTGSASAPWTGAAPVPFSVGWWAVASETVTAFSAAGTMISIPRGCLVRYREWYGARAPNVGLKLTAEEVASWHPRAGTP